MPDLDLAPMSATLGKLFCLGLYLCVKGGKAEQSCGPPITGRLATFSG